MFLCITWPTFFPYGTQDMNMNLTVKESLISMKNIQEIVSDDLYKEWR